MSKAKTRRATRAGKRSAAAAAAVQAPIPEVTTALATTTSGLQRKVPIDNAAAQQVLKALGAIHDRMAFANLHGFGFEGKRDYYSALGYTRVLTPELMWDRYRRNGVARRLVNMLPNATWRSGADLVEDDTPDSVTDFEEA